jgi:hypothetical protein
LATSEFFKTLPEENNHPLGEKIAQSGHPAAMRRKKEWACFVDMIAEKET